MNRKILAGIIALFLLTGCSEDLPTRPAADTQTPKTLASTAPATPKPTTSATPTVTRTADATMNFECWIEEKDDYSTYTTIERALEVDGSCEGIFTAGNKDSFISTWEEKTGISLSAEDLELYLGICASAIDYPWDFDDFSSSQVDEVKTTLKFCPDHPKAKSVKIALKKSDENFSLEEENRRVTAGSYFVPEEAAAGKWVSENPVEDCYWEVTSGSGKIIANNFVTKARQIEFTVQEGQSFTVEGCGTVVNK